MKEVRISLTDDQAAAIEAAIEVGIAAGEARSIDEFVAQAVDAYLTPPDLPSREEMYRLALEAEADAEATGGYFTADEVLENVRRVLRD